MPYILRCQLDKVKSVLASIEEDISMLYYFYFVHFFHNVKGWKGVF